MRKEEWVVGGRKRGKKGRTLTAAATIEPTKEEFPRK